MGSPSSSPDVPFPGANSQVTGKPIDEAARPPTRGAGQLLPLEASAPGRREAGWVVRLPLRAEHVAVEKRLVVYERVRVRRADKSAVTRVTADIRREELRVDTDGQALITRADSGSRRAVARRVRS